MNSDVIYKLLGFTLAMVAAPISMYFLTVNSIFRGECPRRIMYGVGLLIWTRECYVCWSYSSRNGEYRAICVYYCGVARGPRRESRRDREEGSIRYHVYGVHGASIKYVISLKFLHLRFPVNAHKYSISVRDYDGLLLTNSSRSALVATPNTNFLSESVTTANSCLSRFSP